MPSGEVLHYEGVLRCEARRLVDNKPCPHPAKYLAPFDDSVVCGIHKRAFLRCIPLADLEPDSDFAGSETQP